MTDSAYLDALILYCIITPIAALLYIWWGSRRRHGRGDQRGL